MTTAYTSLLGLALPVTGELSGTWGDTVNNSITSLLDTSVAGTTNVSTDTDVTLTTTTGAANTARQAILLFSGARTALRTVTAPAQSKIYTVINATTGGFSVKLVGVGPTTGLTIPNGASAVVAWNGSDFVEVGAGSIGNLVVNGTLTVTGATTLQSTLAVTGNITNTAGTANGVAYLNGSKVVTSGSALWFDGTNFGVGTGGNTLNHQSVVYKVGANAVYQQIANGSTGLGATNGIRVGLSSAGVGEWYSPTAAISYIDNSEAMRLTSTGLGIGTSSPAVKLEVVAPAGDNIVSTFRSGDATAANNAGGGFRSISSATATSRIAQMWLDADGANLSGGDYFYIQKNGNSGNVDLVQYSNAAMTFTTNATERMRLDSSGNLGIGTSSPSNPLHIVSNTVSQLNVAALSGNTNAQINFEPTGTGIALIGPANNVAFAFRTNATERLRISADGNLGLGVTPSAWNSVLKAVSVGRAGSNIYGQTSANLTGITANAIFDSSDWKYVTTDNASRYQQNGGVHSWYTAPSGTAGNAITFTQAMTLDASGNLGVGVTSPATRLEVNGVSEGEYFRAGGGTISARSLQFSSFTVSGLAGVGHQINVPNASGVLTFATGSTERARIDGSGNLLVGTTTAVGKVTIQDGALAFSGNASAPASNVGIYRGGSADNLIFATGGSERARIDSSGNFLVGTTSIASGYLFQAQGWGRFRHPSGDALLSIIAGNTTGSSLLYFGDTASDGIGQVGYNHTSNDMYFVTNGSERARIDSSGNLLVGATTAHNFGIPSIQAGGSNANAIISVRRDTTSAADQVIFYNPNGSVGSISTSGSATTYSTSSDYRLKNTIAPMTGALAKVALLKPCTYKWNVDGSDGEGFIAHELAEVMPQCVNGEKDAVDEEGNPKYQGIDTSFLVATLTAAIQEQQAIIDSLKARLDAANL